jgi:hypothetical protein
MGIFKGTAAYALLGRMGPTFTSPPGASTTAASVVSSRKSEGLLEVQFDDRLGMAQVTARRLDLVEVTGADSREFETLRRSIGTASV